MPYSDFFLYDEGSVQLAFALDQDQINRLKEDLQIIGAIQNVGAIGPGEILVESTKCPAGSSSTTVDCTKLQSRSERPEDLLATEFIVTIWPTKQNAQRAFDEAEKSAKQNPVSSDEVNKLTAYGFKPSFFLADDRKGFTSAYTLPNEIPEKTGTGPGHTGVTVASGLVCGTVTAAVSHKTHMISSSAPELQSQYPQQTLIMGFTTVTEIAGEIFDRLLSNNLCGESQVKQAACLASPKAGVVQSSFSSSPHNNSVQHMNYHPTVAVEQDRSRAAPSYYANQADRNYAGYMSAEQIGNQNYFTDVQDVKTHTAKFGGPINYHKKPWKLTCEVVDKEGLVLKDIKAGWSDDDKKKEIAFKSFSVPHFKIESYKGSKIVRFDKTVTNGLILK